jgi:hypothetical protein
MDKQLQRHNKHVIDAIARELPGEQLDQLAEIVDVVERFVIHEKSIVSLSDGVVPHHNYGEVWMVRDVGEPDLPVTTREFWVWCDGATFWVPEDSVYPIDRLSEKYSTLYEYIRLTVKISNRVLRKKAHAFFGMVHAVYDYEWFIAEVERRGFDSVVEAIAEWNMPDEIHYDDPYLGDYLEMVLDSELPDLSGSSDQW